MGANLGYFATDSAVIPRESENLATTGTAK
jgi:hypothetical protein